MKESFEIFVDDWESNPAGKCGHLNHSGLEYYYVSVLHQIFVIRKLIK
jgi:hypothetical protein